MFTKETVGEIIEDCRLRAELFRERHENAGKASVKISTAGVDGGGLSTFGKSAVIGEDDVYECHDGYLYIHRDSRGYSLKHSASTLTESVVFIPYESIVAIECSVSAYV